MINERKVCILNRPVPKAPASATGEATHCLAPGDMVEVAEGELLHLQGKVIKVTMLPKLDNLTVSTACLHSDSDCE